MATNNIPPSSGPSSEESDKFQLFERWLRINGAQFPLLELRKYDSPKNDTNEEDLRQAGRLSNLSTDNNNEAEEKKGWGMQPTPRGQ
mmetsp:Transcript_10500/g.18639  ORF Transcript_10500/g.18639 Transcript_10500/m.18639 type:complete len:87 (+) Transcript_10500:353-613(+)